MALGTITNDPINPAGGPNMVFGPFRVTHTTVVGDGSYPTGGSVITAAQLGLQRVIWAIVHVKVTGAVGAVTNAYYDVPTSSLLVYAATGQVAATTVLTTNTFEIIAFGL